MTPVDQATSGEVRELQRRLRDVLAFAGLFALWPGRDAVGVAEAFAGAAVNALELELICLRLHVAQGTVTHVVRASRSLDPGELRRIGAALQPWLDREALEPFSRIPDPVTGRELTVARTLLGGAGEDGMVLAGTHRPEFPTDFERLLLALGSNQVAAALKERRLMAEGEARFQARADTAPVMLWTSDSDNLCDWFNKPWLEFTGRTAEQERGRGWMEGVHREDYERCLVANVDAVRQHQPFDTEYRLRRHDGQDRWVVSRGVPRYDAAGAFTGFIGSAIDITERKAAEREMRNFVSVVEQSTDFVGMAGLDGRVLFLNAAGRKLVGLSSEEEAARTGVLDYVFPEDRAVALSALELALQGEQWTGELRLRHLQTGRAIPVCASVFLLRDETDRPICIATVTRDLTAQKATEEHLRQQDRLKDEFLATLSHELRTPLNAIVGWAHILNGGAPDSATGANGVQTILRSAHALNQLVSDILDVSRIIAGKLVLNVAPTSLVGVVEAALDTVRPAARAKEITLVPALDGPPEGFSGDPDRLQQVVWNLLLNAVKFTPRGGRVQVRLSATNSHVEIVVVDDGPGISPDFLPHVFERFRQADSSTTRRQVGLGLGLAIVRHLVELHGGEVHAANRDGQPGAVFTVSLPRQGLRSDLPSALASPGLEPGAAWRQHAPRLDGVKVLVVDDEAEARELVAVTLQSCGARTIVAESAPEALRGLARERPDLIIADIAMPGEDGYELLSRVRSLPVEQGGSTPALALTAYAGPDDRLHVLRAGFQMHLAKPAHPAELIAAVASLVSPEGGPGEPQS